MAIANLIYCVFGTIVRVSISIIMNEAILACRLLKVEGSYMMASTVLGAIVLVKATRRHGGSCPVALVVRGQQSALSKKVISEKY